jgi:hypothetical protein
MDGLEAKAVADGMWRAARVAADVLSCIPDASIDLGYTPEPCLLQLGRLLGVEISEALYCATDGTGMHVISHLSTIYLGVRVDAWSTRPATDADRANIANIVTYRPAAGNLTESA